MITQQHSASINHADRDLYARERVLNSAIIAAEIRARADRGTPSISKQDDARLPGRKRASKPAIPLGPSPFTAITI
jgi:hypothetical protein